METQLASTIGAPLTSAAVRFSHVANKSGNEKMPVYRYAVALPAPFDGLQLEGAIYANRDKTGAITGHSVSVPGGTRFPVLTAAPQVLNLEDGRRFVLKDADPVGVIKLDEWSGQILTALHEFQQSGDSEQRISF